jgi:hypothetical protein
MSGMSLPTAAGIAVRAAAVRADLDAAAQRVGRDPSSVRIVAITKTWPAATCRAALGAGLAALGENRVQEALPKVAALPEAEWHLVGHLQSNKARAAATAFDWIHAVDSPALLRRLDRDSHEAERRPSLLLQVNVTGEPQKHGLAPAGLEDPDLLAAVAELRDARLVGLMTIAARGADPRAAFARLRALRDAMEQRTGIGLPELSMGMSDDATVAVEEGATLVRIGTAIFGRREAAGG